MRFAPVIDSVIDARYRMMSRLPRSMRSSFTRRSSRNSRTTWSSWKIAMSVKESAPKGMIEMKSRKNAPCT